MLSTHLGIVSIHAFTIVDGGYHSFNSHPTEGEIEVSSIPTVAFGGAMISVLC